MGFIRSADRFKIAGSCIVLVSASALGERAALIRARSVSDGLMVVRCTCGDGRQNLPIRTPRSAKCHLLGTVSYIRRGTRRRRTGAGASDGHVWKGGRKIDRCRFIMITV